jgi:hypothetical protein
VAISLEQFPDPVLSASPAQRSTSLTAASWLGIAIGTLILLAIVAALFMLFVVRRRSEKFTTVENDRDKPECELITEHTIPECDFWSDFENPNSCVFSADENEWPRLASSNRE